MNLAPFTHYLFSLSGDTPRDRSINKLIISRLKEIGGCDDYTCLHGIRVALYALRIGKQMGLDISILIPLESASLLHDFGKLQLLEIVNKKGELTAEERKKINTHTIIPFNQGDCHNLNDVGKTVIDSIRSHHERMDSGGYPDNLEGKNIPLNAKIIALADCWDALTTNRPYRNAMSLKNAFNEMEQIKEGKFDPEVFKAAMDCKLFSDSISL